jgi:hypothetical protein
MASWGEVKGYLKNNYTVQKEEDNLVILLQKFTDGRSQLVFVYEREVNGVIWADISSPIGSIGPQDIYSALEMMENAPCGGLTKVGETIAVRHCMPIADLSSDEINGPIKIVAGAADTLEEKFIGGDNA